MVKKAKKPSRVASPKKAKPVKKRPAAAKAKKAPARKAARPQPVKKAPRAVKPAEAPVLPWRQPLAGESLVGVVEDFFGHLSVIALTLTAPLAVGDTIHVRGHTTDMTETVESLQIEHRPVTSAQKGDGIGIKAVGKCRAGDYVYRVG